MTCSRALPAAASAGLVLALLLAGCGGGGKTRPPPGPAAKPLTFWHIQTTSPMKDVVEAAVGRVRSDRLGVEVSAIENDAFKNKLAVAMAAGSPPGVFHTWGGGVLAADARAGRVLDLTGLVDAGHVEALNPAALDFCRADGRLLALPADVAAVVFWYNRELFKAQGLEPPRTHAELVAACVRLKAAGVTPIALGNSEAWPGAFFFAYYALRLGGREPFDAALARGPGKGFEHESFVRAGKLVRELVEKDCFSPGFNGIDFQRARGLFFEGRAAMLLMGPWILGNARKEAPAGFVGKLGCFAFPAVEGGSGDASMVLGGVNAAYAASAKAEPAGAAALLTELTSARTAAEWAKTGRIPALRTELVAPLLPAETREVAAILGAARAIQLYYDQALPPELAQLHKSSTQGIFAGSKTPEEAARLMEEKARAIAERAGK
jgi:raffinose/stachyose/melibiose transport system substrate-binding protein